VADRTGAPVAADGIEEGRRLIRVGPGAGAGLAERLMGRLHRLAWRTPLYDRRLRGRHPLKLLAVPDDPLAGDADAGLALLDGRVRHRGEERDLSTIDFAAADWGPAMNRYLQGFGWLRDLSTVATRTQGAPVAELLTARWLNAHGTQVDDLAWAPDLWGRRILFWTAHAPLILSSADAVYRSAVLNALARGARHLDGAAEKAPAGRARVAAWAGVVAAGLLLPGGEPRLAFGEAGLARALGTALFDDGGAASREPAALMEMVELLAFVAAAYDARGGRPPAGQAATLERMVSALLGVTHGDRGLSGWQGGGAVPADRVARVIAASGVRTRPLRTPRDWGYQRLASGPAVAVFDAAPPPVGRPVAAGCASTLAFEFSDGPVRLVVNCGGAAAGEAGLPAALLDALRTTAAHSTLTLAEANSTALLPDGTLGRGVGEVELFRRESDGGARVEATHDGYVRRHGFAHRRQLTLMAGGAELRGEDQLLPRGRAPRGATGFVIRFHLGLGVAPASVAEGGGTQGVAGGGGGSESAVLLSAADGACLWQFRCSGAALSVDESLWIDGDGRARRTRQLVLTADAPPGGAALSWVFRRVR